MARTMTTALAPELRQVREALGCERDPALAVAKLLKKQRNDIVELLDAYADAMLARGASPLSVTAIRDAADVIAGRLPFPRVPANTALATDQWPRKNSTPRGAFALRSRG